MFVEVLIKHKRKEENMTLRPCNSNFAENSYLAHKGQGNINAAIHTEKARAYRDLLVAGTKNDSFTTSALKNKANLIDECGKMLSTINDTTSLKVLQQFKYKLLNAGIDKNVIMKSLSGFIKRV